MADGATYPARFTNSDGQTVLGLLIVFTDDTDQPSGPGGGGSVTTPDAAGNTLPISIKTGDSSGGDGGDITIQGGEGGGGDGGSVIIDGGSGDDSDGSVVIQGEATFRVNGVEFTENVTVTYADGALTISDAGGGIGVGLTMVGIAQIHRGDPMSYPDTGGNYILFVDDPSTGLTWGVTPAGYEYFDNPNGVGAPADGDLNAHQRRQWYDPTTGAPAFRFKQKDAAGTVTAGKSASLATDGTAFTGVSKANVPQTIPTVQDVIDALVILGLVEQSD